MRRREVAVVDHRLDAVGRDVEQFDVEVRLGRVERGAERHAGVPDEHLVGGQRFGRERHGVDGLLRPLIDLARLAERHRSDRARLGTERTVGVQEPSSTGRARWIPSIEFLPPGSDADRSLVRDERRRVRDRSIGSTRHPVVEPGEQHARRQLRIVGEHLVALSSVARRPRRLLGERDRKEMRPRPVDRPCPLGDRLDVGERARAEEVVVPPADGEHGDRHAVEDVDERAVAPVVVERGMGAVGGELGVGVDRSAARHGGDVGPAVDLASLGRLHAAREDHVVVQRSRRLHRGDREEVFGLFDRRAVAGLAAEALAEHADPTVAELLRRQPLDQVVGVTAALPEAAVLPPAARVADAAHRPDERGVAAGRRRSRPRQRRSRRAPRKE